MRTYVHGVVVQNTGDESGGRFERLEAQRVEATEDVPCGCYMFARQALRWTGGAVQDVYTVYILVQGRVRMVLNCVLLKSCLHYCSLL